MNVTVLGATGAIGQLVVGDLLEAGHQVTAYLRNPAKTSATWDDRIRVVAGEMSDKTAIDSAAAGADAVISALGPSMDCKAAGLPLVEGTRHILDAMTRHGVHRYIGHGTPSVADRRDRMNAQMRLIGWMGRTFRPRAYTELVQMSRLVTESGLDWTIVRFTAPKNGPTKGIHRAGFYGTTKNRLQHHPSRHRRLHHRNAHRQHLH